MQVHFYIICFCSFCIFCMFLLFLHFLLLLHFLVFIFFCISIWRLGGIFVFLLFLNFYCFFLVFCAFTLFFFLTNSWHLNVFLFSTLHFLCFLHVQNKNKISIFCYEYSFSIIYVAIGSFCIRGPQFFIAFKLSFT